MVFRLTVSTCEEPEGEIRCPYGFIGFKHIGPDTFDHWQLHKDGFTHDTMMLELARVAVTPKQRGRGHGSKLVRCLAQWATRRDYDVIILGVHPLDRWGRNTRDETSDEFATDKIKLRNFYTRLGFEPVVVGDPYRMKLELS